MRQVNGTFPTWASQVALADLWTFTLVDGTVYRWTSWDQDLSFGSTWSSSGPLIKRNSTRLIAGLEVDSLNLTVMVGDTVTLKGLLFPLAALNGILDGAVVKLERAYMVTSGTVQCTVHLFEGKVSDIKGNGTEVQIAVKSLLELLNQPWPRNLYMPTCSHKLYGTGCGVSEIARREVVTISSGDTQGFSMSSARPAGWFDLGKATFQSGSVAGIVMGIKRWNGSRLDLMGVLPFVPSGSVILVPGCDKAYTTCRDKYANLNRFKGFPWIPRPETAV